jgi:hypothetical protein
MDMVKANLGEQIEAFMHRLHAIAAASGKSVQGVHNGWVVEITPEGNVEQAIRQWWKGNNE